MVRGFYGSSILALPLLGLAACQTGSPSASLSINTKDSPVKAISSIAQIAQKCWFKSGDRAFKGMRISNEVNSYAGRPRILLVKRSDPNGLPLLVVQAETKGNTTSGTYTNIQTFGPLLQTNSGKRITDDVSRWSKKNPDCKQS